MIITDPAKKPSERFFQILCNYFVPKGFVYKKSYNQFARISENRKEMVSIFFNRTVNLSSATLTWSILFPNLEKIYEVIDIETTKRKAENTIWNDLLNYSERSNNNDPWGFDLYDNKNHKYDNFSLNDASVKLIESYEKYVEPYLAYYKELKNLERTLNKIPLHHHNDIGYGGRQIAIGLALGKLFDNENFANLRGLYQEYISNDKEGPEFKNKMQLYYNNTLKYLDTVDLQKIILS